MRFRRRRLLIMYFEVHCNLRIPIETGSSSGSGSIMTEKNDFASVQRRNSEVMAKYEWTSSLMSMQKSAHEIHDRRSKTHRKANEFLQGLLEKRSDGSLLDDHGALDRYQRFLKYKTKSNGDDDDELLNEFDRRLRALSKERRTQVMNKKETMLFQASRDTDIDRYWRKFPEKSSLSKSTTTTASNHSLRSSITSENNPSSIHLSADDRQSTPSLERSSSNETNSQTIHKPKVCRADGTEVLPLPTRRTLRRASSNILIFNHCHFPRALKSCKPMNSSIHSEEHVSSMSSIVQQDHTELFHLLDQIENESSHVNFTNMLDQFIVSSTQISPIGSHISSTSEQQSENQEEIFIHSNLFDQTELSSPYYTTLNINVDNAKRISVYTMTIGIVQLTPSVTVPYSILNGRRPFLQSSIQTNFRKVYSKRPKHISQVTAIESSPNTELLRENDIILKVRRSDDLFLDKQRL